MDSVTLGNDLDICEGSDGGSNRWREARFKFDAALSCYIVLNDFSIRHDA